MTTSNMIFRLELGKHSAPGGDRSQNEDNVGFFIPQQHEILLLRGQMFMVADGSGEQGLGEFASKLAVQTIIQEYFEEPWIGTVEEMLTRSFIKANRTLIEANIENRSEKRFSTSMTCGVINQETLYLAHIGNCGAFLLSYHVFESLTQSHSFDVDKGDRQVDIQGEENGTVLVRALGIDEDLKVDIFKRKIQINDLILFCTDGIYNYVDEKSIQSIIAAVPPQQAGELLVEQARLNETPDDATAMLVKVKSIRRLDADEPTTPTVIDHSEPAERQIVIKGVRYRSTWQEEELPAEVKETVTEFSQDRDMRRPIIKRKTNMQWKQKFFNRQIFNIITILVFIILVAFLIIKYVPEYLQSRKIVAEGDITKETLDQKAQPKLKSDEQKEEAVITPVTPAEIDEFKETGEDFTGQELSTVAGAQKLDVVIIDGSLKQNLRWNIFIEGMKQFSSADQIDKLKSSFRIQKSKILWRRVGNSEHENVIQQRVDQYQRFFAQNFQISPEVYPLDFTLVIGANFKQPKLPAISTSVAPMQTDDAYYLEILNGFTTSGLARRLNEQLNGRKLNDKMLVVVDYRNADKKNYRVSFIKCDPSRNGIASQLGNLVGQRISVVNTQLFDIKLIVGTDIQL